MKVRLPIENQQPFSRRPKFSLGCLLRAMTLLAIVFAEMTWLPASGILMIWVIMAVIGIVVGLLMRRTNSRCANAKFGEKVS